MNGCKLIERKKMRDYRCGEPSLYCSFCDCWIVDDFDEDEQDPRCHHCGGELDRFDPEPHHPVYDELREKYL
jgi:hypothetical protein